MTQWVDSRLLNLNQFLNPNRSLNPTRLQNPSLSIFHQASGPTDKEIRMYGDDPNITVESYPGAEPQPEPQPEPPSPSYPDGVTGED